MYYIYTIKIYTLHLIQRTCVYIPHPLLIEQIVYINKLYINRVPTQLNNISIYIAGKLKTGYIYEQHAAKVCCTATTRCTFAENVFYRATLQKAYNIHFIYVDSI